MYAVGARPIRGLVQERAVGGQQLSDRRQLSGRVGQAAERAIGDAARTARVVGG
jgi:hypothetical protein